MINTVKKIFIYVKPKVEAEDVSPWRKLIAEFLYPGRIINEGVLLQVELQDEAGNFSLVHGTYTKTRIYPGDAVELIFDDPFDVLVTSIQSGPKTLQ